MKNGDPLIGIGGAPTRATTLPTGAAERKQYPVASGCLDYFPDALAAVSHLSYIGNEQHNKGQPLHWARGKSGDEADTLLRHFLQRGTIDSDGVRHSVKMAWRALALLQKELEAEQVITPSYPVQSVPEPGTEYWSYQGFFYKYPASLQGDELGLVWRDGEKVWERECDEPARRRWDAKQVSSLDAHKLGAKVD